MVAHPVGSRSAGFEVVWTAGGPGLHAKSAGHPGRESNPPPIALGTPAARLAGTVLVIVTLMTCDAVMIALAEALVATSTEVAVMVTTPPAGELAGAV